MQRTIGEVKCAGANVLSERAGLLAWFVVKEPVMKMNEKIRGYHLIDGREIVFIGITDDLERRTAKHRITKSFDHYEYTGEMSQERAEAWEINALAQYKKNNGKWPKYNEKDLEYIG